jgi:hypothetical protein
MVGLRVGKRARANDQGGQRAGGFKFLEGLFMVGAECSTVNPLEAYPQCNKK